MVEDLFDFQIQKQKKFQDFIFGEAQAPFTIVEYPSKQSFFTTWQKIIIY